MEERLASKRRHLQHESSAGTDCFVFQKTTSANGAGRQVPPEARRIAEKFEVHDTPKHGSWLRVAAIELRVFPCSV